MPATRENVLQALFGVLQSVPGAKVLRGDVLPERIPAGGLVILRDGDPSDPDVTLSPLAYHWQHRAEVEVIVQGKTSTDRDNAFNTLVAGIGAALAADRTLGGLCDWTEPDAPQPVDLPIEGAPALKAAVIAVTLHYTTSDPLA
ncbi:MAG: acyl-CoA transferase [Alphaproteobacteria bacterium]|nr:MAG: acyl-CoA transferase [Alphaproteobacteria bacterium]